MGIDLLDLSFRIDKEFGVDPRGEELTSLALQRHPPDVTAGEMYELVCIRRRSKGLDVSDDSWDRFRAIVAKTLGFESEEVRKESWLVKELGME